MSIIYLLAITLLVGYMLLMAIYLYGWLRIKQTVYAKEQSSEYETYTILLSVRNEEKNVRKCLEYILTQKYPADKLEVIVINDHSTDNTELEVQSLIQSNPHYKIRLFNLSDNESPSYTKKAAITFGIEHAIGKYIILTDADCTRGDLWLASINQCIIKTAAKMIYAPVEFVANNVFQKIQAMEFAGLVGIGASAIRLKNPNMCSAANLVFEKSVFFEVGGYKGNDGIASGDDEFLLHKVFKYYPSQVVFLKDIEAIVHTSANASVKELTEQRRRWVSKSTKYENRYITAILVCAYFFNLSIVLFTFIDIKMFAILLMCKMLSEGCLLFFVLKFFKKAHYLFLLPIAEFFHVIYVLVIGVMANIGTYNWKGRSLK